MEFSQIVNERIVFPVSVRNELLESVNHDYPSASQISLNFGGTESSDVHYCSDTVLVRFQDLKQFRGRAGGISRKGVTVLLMRSCQITSLCCFERLPPLNSDCNTLLGLQFLELKLNPPS